jgi:hypothetical protein
MLIETDIRSKMLAFISKTKYSNQIRSEHSCGAIFTVM